MFYKFSGVKVAYSLVGPENAESTTVMLHGWGCDGHIFDNLISLMPERRFLIIDFPPFGKSDIEPKDWNIFTYANMVISLINHCKFKHVNVCGHSFGGRVAIILAALSPELVDRLVLLDSAGLKPRRKPGYYIRLCYYKLAKHFGFMLNAGSDDYKALSSQMKKVFVSVVNEHLDSLLPLIKQKTLIIFGKNDKETPIYMAKRLNKNIKNSRLEILENAGHFCFVDSLMTCFRLIDGFLEE